MANNLSLKEEFEAGQKLYNDIINSTLSSNDENFQVIFFFIVFYLLINSFKLINFKLIFHYV